MIVQADTTSDRSLHTSFQSNARDLLKEGFLPLLASGTAAQNAASGICLKPHLHFILHLASTAAELIGWRDPRVLTSPYLRNYGLINALWVGVVKCWAAVPLSLRPTLAAAGIGGEAVARQLMGYLSKDLEMLCRRKECADVKLLQFWVVNITKVMSSYPEEAAPAVWEVLWGWASRARLQIAAVEKEGSSEGAALAHAVRAGSLWIRIARVQAQALNLMGPAAATSAISKASNELQSVENHENNVPPKAWRVASAAELLGQAGSLLPVVRAACMPLFKATLLSIPSLPTIAAAEDCRILADSCLVYALSLAAAAAAAEGGSHAPSGTSSNAGPAQAAWEDCQLCLLECSLRPHPAMLYVLRLLWSSLAAMTTGPTLKHWVTGLNELLTATAAVEAAAENRPLSSASPATTQVCHILAAVLEAAPAQLSQGFCLRFLDLQPPDANDRCKLAALAAMLRVAALSGRPACCTPALPIVLHLCEVLQRNTGASLKGKSAPINRPTAVGDSLHLAWVVECLGAGIQCLGAMAGAECAAPADQLESAVAAAAVQSLALLKHPDAATAFFLPATLRTLQLALQLHPGCLETSELESLVPCLESFLSVPAAAAGIANLTPALRVLPQPPKALFEALLGPSQSPLLQFLGKEAYVKYAKECKEENVLSALPRQFIDARTGNLNEAIAPTLEKYLQRTPAAAPVLDPGHPMATAVAVELEKVANSAQARLIAAANEARAAQDAIRCLKIGADVGVERVGMGGPQAASVVHNADEHHSAMQVDPSAGNGIGLSPEVAEVMGAIQRLQGAWDPAMVNSEDGTAVRQARDALSALLA